MSEFILCFLLPCTLIFFTGYMLGKLHLLNKDNTPHNETSKKIKSINHSMRKSADDYKSIITETITYEDDTIETNEYIGSVTVWYTYPEFKRCSSAKENDLYDVHEKLKYLEKEKQNN